MIQLSDGSYIGNVNSWPVYRFRCSHCGNNYIIDTDSHSYCPYCGVMLQDSLKQTYTLSCDECGHIWDSEEAFPSQCPKCGADRSIK